MNEDVTTYIENIDLEWQSEISRTIRKIIHESVPEIQERIQYGKPHFLKNGKYAYVLGTAKNWVNFTIVNADPLEAPDGFFEAGGSSDRKSIKIRDGQVVDYELLTRLMQQAAKDL